MRKQQVVVTKSIEEIRRESEAAQAAMDAEIAAYIAENEAMSNEATPTSYTDENGVERKIDLSAIAYMKNLD